MYLGMESQSQPPNSESPLPSNQINHFQSTQQMISAVPKQMLENYSHYMSLNTTQSLLKIQMGEKEDQLPLEAQNQSLENKQKEEQRPLESEELFIELHKLNDRFKLAQGLHGRQKNQEIKKILHNLVKVLQIQQAIKEKQLRRRAELQQFKKEEQLRREAESGSLEKEEKEQQLLSESENQSLEKEAKEEQLPFEGENQSLEKEECLIESDNKGVISVAQGKQKPAEELQLSYNQQDFPKYIFFNKKLVRYQFYLQLRTVQKLKEDKREADQANTRVKEALLVQSVLDDKLMQALYHDQNSRETQYYEMAYNISSKLVMICFEQRKQCQAKFYKERAKVAQMMKKLKKP